MNKLETKVIYNQPGAKAEGAVIWLHGLGADYNDFVPIVAELNLKSAVKFVFPNAPIMPITINGGMAMRAWYDITDFNDLHREVDSAGITASIARVEGLIAELLDEGFTSEQIVVAGFSQGGVIAYYTALTSKYNLAGLLVLSAYLPDLSLLDVAKIQHRQGLGILVCHGSQDQVVNINLAQRAVLQLQQLGLKYEWHEYPMAHSVCYEEVLHIGDWLDRVLNG